MSAVAVTVLCRHRLLPNSPKPATVKPVSNNNRLAGLYLIYYAAITEGLSYLEYTYVVVWLARPPLAWVPSINLFVMQGTLVRNPYRSV